MPTPDWFEKCAWAPCEWDEDGDSCASRRQAMAVLGAYFRIRPQLKRLEIAAVFFLYLFILLKKGEEVVKSLKLAARRGPARHGASQAHPH